MKKKTIAPAYRVAVTGILAAVAAALSFLESLLPALPFLPPGAKPGLSNIAVMFAAVSFGLPTMLAVILIKSMFTLFLRGLAAFFISLCGGLLSGLVMFALSRIRQRTDADGDGKRAAFGYVGISAVSAVCHNLGQLLAASLTAGVSLAPYLPLLTLFGLLFGAVTGTILGAVMPVLQRQTAAFARRNGQNGKNGKADPSAAPTEAENTRNSKVKDL